MIDCGSLEYSQARVQARHGQRPDEGAWQRLQTTRDFGALLTTARTGALGPWVADLTPQSTSQQIDAAMRMHWRACVADVTGWMPVEWRAALAWCAFLPDLPALQHLARGGSAQAWMADDPDWQALSVAPVDDRATILSAGPLASLAGAWSAPSALGKAWLAEWEQRLPQALTRADESLRRLVDTMLAHGAAFAGAAPGSGETLRRDLRARLSAQMRRATLEPAIAFIHLGLCALDLERLRGELMCRALFASAKVA
jgi:hypothetical protein